MNATSSLLRLFLVLMALAFITSGCVTPLTMEQQSDWRWKQYNPDYRPAYPDPGIGAR